MEQALHLPESAVCPAIIDCSATPARTHQRKARSRTPARCKHFVRHHRRFHRWLYLVDAHDVDTAQNAGNHCRQRPIETLGRWCVYASALANGASDERLARGSCQQRKTHPVQLIEVRQQRVVLLKVLAEAKTRVKHDALAPDSTLECDLHPVRQLMLQQRDNVRLKGEVPPLVRT